MAKLCEAVISTRFGSIFPTPSAGMKMFHQKFVPGDRKSSAPDRMEELNFCTFPRPGFGTQSFVGCAWSKFAQLDMI
jgi:hypothetical protein